MIEKENKNIDLLIEDIKTMEKEFFYNDNEDFFINYYSFIQNSSKNKKIVLDIFSNLTKEKNKKIQRYIKEITNKFKKKTNYDNFYIIKSNKNFIDFAFSIIITKIFSRKSIYNFKEKEIIQDIYSINNELSSKIEQFFVYLEIKLEKKIDIDYKIIKDLCMAILISLTHSEIINKEILYSKKEKKKRTFLYIKNLDRDETIFLTFKKYEIYERFNLENKKTYIYSHHFSLTKDIFKKNIKSNYIFITNLDRNMIENITNNSIYIDNKMLEIIFDKLLEEHNYKKSELEKEYEILWNKSIDFIKNKDLSSLSLISNKISKLQNLIKIKNVLKYTIKNNKIYLPFSFDFRGRLYYESEISPTYYKEFRFCLNLGMYEKLESEFNPFNDAINNEIKKYFYKITELKKYKLNRKKESVKVSIIWLLISLGEIRKKILGKEVHISKFIDEGIKVLNEEINLLEHDVYERIEIEYIKNIIKEIDKNIYIKWLISKDATASVYQHLIKTCGYTDKEYMKWCNLNSKDTWYDTYSFIIEKFLEKNSVKYRDLFNRKNLKKIMMTENYGASFSTCKKYFNENIDRNLYNEEELNKDLEKFYIYISKNKDMFKIDLDSILDFFRKNDYIVYLDNKSKDIIVLKYYRGSIDQKEIKYNNKRYTYQHFGLDLNKIDKKKTESSIKANYIHTIDAALVRWILSKIKIITIHDCFFIDYLNLTYLTSLINEGMRIQFHELNDDKNKEIFSIFIVI